MTVSVRKNVVVMRRAAAQLGGNTTSGSKGQNAPKDPRIGSKTPYSIGRD